MRRTSNSAHGINAVAPFTLVGTQREGKWSFWYGTLRLACIVDYLRPPLSLTFKDATGKLITVSYCGAASAYGLKFESGFRLGRCRLVRNGPLLETEYADIPHALTISYARDGGLFFYSSEFDISLAPSTALVKIKYRGLGFVGPIGYSFSNSGKYFATGTSAHRVRSVYQLAIILFVFGFLATLVTFGIYYYYLKSFCNMLTEDEKEVAQIMNEGIAVKFGKQHYQELEWQLIDWLLSEGANSSHPNFTKLYNYLSNDSYSEIEAPIWNYFLGKLILFSFNRQQKGSYSYVPNFYEQILLDLAKATNPIFGDRLWISNLERNYFQRFTPLAELGVTLMLAINFEREMETMPKHFQLLKYRRKDDEPVTKTEFMQLFNTMSGSVLGKTLEEDVKNYRAGIVNGPTFVYVKTNSKSDPATNSTHQFTFRVDYASKIELYPFPSKQDRVQFELTREYKYGNETTISYSVRKNMKTKVKYPSNSYDIRELSEEEVDKE